jgi:Ribbon-helix-helix protein, copG family
MSRVQTMVQLTDELVELLDREAERRGMSRSALIRIALEEFFQHDREAEISRRIVEGYTRIPPATPDDWGDLAAMTDQAGLDVLQRLDAEERRQGLGPW